MAKDSRRADGKPETEKDVKFFDLRESGEKRLIDNNGNVIADMGK